MERRSGTKTENQDREPRLRTKTKHGEQIIGKDKDREKKRKKVHPVSAFFTVKKKEKSEKKFIRLPSTICLVSETAV